ncbi:transmembrane amino acid transporter protein, partial [Helicosporidium sp. ATCC 50920]
MSGKAAPYALTGEEAVDSENLPAYSEVDIILRRPHDGTLSFEIETDHPAPHARWYHAALHSMCAVVGAGVLGLPYSIAHLGWVGGLTCLTLLTSFSIYTSWLLSALHERAVPGRRLNTYHDLGEATLGSRLAHLLVTPLQQTLLVGLCITYTVTAGQSLKGLIFHDCVGTACQVGTAPWIALFGVLQLCLSAIPDFHSLRWVSLLGSAMSVGYTSIAAYGVIAAA